MNYNHNELNSEPIRKKRKRSHYLPLHSYRPPSFPKDHLTGQATVAQLKLAIQRNAKYIRDLYCC